MIKNETIEVTCPHCGTVTDRLYECNECGRSGCIKCMPRLMDADCPECEGEEPTSIELRS